MSNPNITLSFCYTQQREVSFSDTDMGGIVHFPNYLKYVEDAEYQFLHSIGLSAILEDERGKYGFPRIRIACDYHHPAQYGDVLAIDLACFIIKERNLAYRFQISKESTLVATGCIEAACCRFPLDGLPYAIPLPVEVAKQLEEAGAVHQDEGEEF